MSISEKTTDGPPKTVVFFHPDLGIGGAERLIVDAAVGLQKRGHRVVIFTSFCDPTHCFDEARDGTLDVRVCGDWLIPPNILSRFSILCAILRQVHLLLATFASGEMGALGASAFVVDQLSAGLPLLRYLYPSTGILFYCHFPDLLLARGRGDWWKRAYRAPFDALELWSMGFASRIAVNSGFTRGVVARVWPSLAQRRELEIIYPCVSADETEGEKDGAEQITAWKNEKILLSINRFEQKKDIGLAIKAFAGLGVEGRKGVRLVIAGGYDKRVPENVNYHLELIELAHSLDLTTATATSIPTALSPAQPSQTASILFLLSVPARLKTLLLNTATLLLYTPRDEHFGIVPLEAMRAHTPVLATSTGGPLETIQDARTGWLRPPADVPAWTAVLRHALALDPQALARIGAAGALRVTTHFSAPQMSARFDAVLDALIAHPHPPPPVSSLVYPLASLLLLLLLLLLECTLWLTGPTLTWHAWLPPVALALLSLYAWLPTSWALGVGVLLAVLYASARAVGAAWA